MTWRDALTALDSAVFSALADTVSAIYIPAAEVATWHAEKTSTAYLPCTLIIDQETRPRFDGIDAQPAGHEIEVSVRASEVTGWEIGGQFYVPGSGTYAGRWQIIERVDYDGSVYRFGVRRV